MDKQLEDIFDRIETKFHDHLDKEELKQIAKNIYTKINDQFTSNLAKAKNDRKKKLKDWVSDEHTAWRDEQLEEDLKYEFPQYGIEILIVERFLSGAVHIVESQANTPYEEYSTWYEVKHDLNQVKLKNENIFRQIQNIKDLSILVDKVATSPRFIQSWIGNDSYSSDELKKQLDHISHMVTIISNLNFHSNSPNQLSEDPKTRYIEYVVGFYTQEFGIAAPDYLSDCFELIRDYYGYPEQELVSQVIEKCNRQLTRKKESNAKAAEKNKNEFMASLGFSKDKKT